MIVNSPGSCGPSRMSVRAEMIYEVGRLRKAADQLEALAKVIPEYEGDWPPGAADALWELLIRSRR